MAIYRDIGFRVRAARGTKLTQRELGDRIQLSRTSITNLEVGKQQIPVHVLLKIARALHVPAQDLLPETNAVPIRTDVMPESDEPEYSHPFVSAGAKKAQKRR